MPAHELVAAMRQLPDWATVSFIHSRGGTVSRATSVADSAALQSWRGRSRNAATVQMANGMLPVGFGVGEIGSLVRHQANRIILPRLRKVLWFLLLANLLYGAADLILNTRDPVPVAVRLTLLAAVVALLAATRAAGAVDRAVPLTLTALVVGGVQLIAPRVTHGEVASPAVLTIALAAGASMVFPWGVWAQLVTVTGAVLVTAVRIALATGGFDDARLAFPATVAAVALGASVYMAHLSRRNLAASIERRRAESALRAREARTNDQLIQLETSYQTAPVGLGLLDTNLRYLRINEALAEMNGVPVADHIGRTVREIIPELAETIEPLIRRVIDTGEPARDLEISGATPRQPGVTRYWRVDYWPMFDAAGAVTAVSCSLQEITEQKRAREALRENEERLRIVSQATNDAVWDWNLVTDAVWWNNGVRTLFGYAAADVGPTATWWYEHIHPDERERVVGGIHALIDSGEQYWSAEYRYRRADGSYACVLDRGYVFHDESRTPVRMIGAMIDISERKRVEEELARLNSELECRVRERTAQLEAAKRHLENEIAERRQTAEALRESQKQLQDILDNTTAVIYIKGTDGRYLLINRQYETLFHVSGEQARGKTDYDLFPHAAADAFRANDWQVLAANRALTFEETAPQDDGIHTYVSVKFPLHDSAGTPRGVCGISTDITQRKRMEAEVQGSRAQLSALIENTTEAIWSIDRDYRLTVLNPAAMQWFQQGYGKPLRLSDGFEQRSPEAERARWRPLYERALAGERVTFEREYSLGEEPHSYVFSMTPIIADGEITGVTVFAKDITDFKRAEESARRHQAELTHVLRVSTIGEIAAGLAHEINQPLGAIASYAQGCRRRIESGSARPDEIVPALENIAGQALRAGEIIRRLRQLVQKGETAHENADLNAVVTDAMHVILPQARWQDVAVGVDLAPGLPRVRVDRIQIEQVVLNLILNALEAVQECNGRKPELSVGTRLADAGAVEVVVRDNGPGLESAIIEKMFEPFFTSKPSGLGMGLAISRSIVREHGGRIWATNNADHGATFHFELPIPNGRGDASPSTDSDRERAARDPVTA